MRLFLADLMTGGRHKLDTLSTVSRVGGFRKRGAADKSQPDRDGLSVRTIIALLDILTYFSTILIFSASFQCHMVKGMASVP